MAENVSGKSWSTLCIVANFWLRCISTHSITCYHEVSGNTQRESTSFSIFDSVGKWFSRGCYREDNSMLAQAYLHFHLEDKVDFDGGWIVWKRDAEDHERWACGTWRNNQGGTCGGSHKKHDGRQRSMTQERQHKAEGFWLGYSLV